SEFLQALDRCCGQVCEGLNAGIIEYLCARRSNQCDVRKVVLRRYQSSTHHYVAELQRVSALWDNPKLGHKLRSNPARSRRQTTSIHSSGVNQEVLCERSERIDNIRISVRRRINEDVS